MRGFDDDVRAHLRAEMEKRGVTVICGKTVTGVAATQDTYIASLSDGSAIEVDKVMFAVGRWPNVAALGLEAAGVRFSNKDGIAVDRFSQTSVPHIHAIGDVTNRLALTPVAIREGHAFADTVFGGRPTAVDHTEVPTAVFSEPEVGVIGLTEAQACQRLPKVDIYKTSFRPMKAALAGRDTAAFMKLVVDGITDRVVGCHIVGGCERDYPVRRHRYEDEGDQADFDTVLAVHPTAAEELVTMREGHDGDPAGGGVAMTKRHPRSCDELFVPGT